MKERKRIANVSQLASDSPAAEERPGPIDRGCPHSKKGFTHGEFSNHKYGFIQIHVLQTGDIRILWCETVDSPSSRKAELIAMWHFFGKENCPLNASP